MQGGVGAPREEQGAGRGRPSGCLELRLFYCSQGPGPRPAFPPPSPTSSLLLPQHPRAHSFAAVESLRGAGSAALPSTLVVALPLFIFLSPGCPHRPPPPPPPLTVLFPGNFCLCLEVPICSFLNCLPRPQVHTFLASPSPWCSSLNVPELHYPVHLPPTHQMTPRSFTELLKDVRSEGHT